MEILKKNSKALYKKRLLISTPTLGVIRYEWAHMRYGQIIPVNWEASGYDLPYMPSDHNGFAVVGYSIDDAYNLIVKKFIEKKLEWLFIIEDDVIIPADCFIQMSHYINKEKLPVVSGLYYLKSSPTVPLLFRGRGNGAYTKFKLGDRVWCDGLPMGCLLLHGSILEYMWENSEEYKISDGTKVKRVFETPRKLFYSPDDNAFATQAGTQDLYFFDRIIREGVLAKTGWKKLAKRKYPFLCDTKMFCRHIDLSTGRQYP